MQALDTGAYQELANAIVLQAVTDYRNALNGRGYDRMSAKMAIKHLERFFRSYYFQLLTPVKGDFLIEELKKEHQEKVERSQNESNIDTGNA